MDNIYEWLGIAADANEAEILAAISAKKQTYQLNTTQEVHIKQVLLTPHLRQHHDLRLASVGHDAEFAADGLWTGAGADEDLPAYTPAPNRLATRTKLKKRKPHPSVILYISLAIAVLVFLLNLWFKLAAI